MNKAKRKFTAVALFLLAPIGAHAVPIVSAIGGDQYQVSFDPISFQITTAGQVASVVFEDFYSSTWTINDGTYISGTAQVSLNGGPIKNLIGNSNTGHYDVLNAVDGNDLLVTILAGFVPEFGTVSVGDVLTISALNYVFSSSAGGFNAASNTGPFNAFLVDNSFRQVSSLGVAAAVPEPATLSLLAAGLLGFGMMRRRRRTT